MSEVDPPQTEPKPAKTGTGFLKVVAGIFCAVLLAQVAGRYTGSILFGPDVSGSETLTPSTALSNGTVSQKREPAGVSVAGESSIEPPTGSLRPVSQPSPLALSAVRLASQMQSVVPMNADPGGTMTLFRVRASGAALFYEHSFNRSVPPENYSLLSTWLPELDGVAVHHDCCAGDDAPLLGVRHN